jgi:hypothetical protein
MTSPTVKELAMNFPYLAKAAALAAIALGSLAVAQAAQAHTNVYFSLGAPAPVYAAPEPVYVAPQAAYVAPGTVYAPAFPVYVDAGHRDWRWRQEELRREEWRREHWRREEWRREEWRRHQHHEWDRH